MDESREFGRGELGGLPIHERIRRLRERLGLASYELAQRAGISPSYMSLIEKGQKIPSQSVAERIARALDDDPELYRGWAHAERHDDVARHAKSVRRYWEYASPPPDRHEVNLIRRGSASAEQLRRLSDEVFGLDTEASMDAGFADSFLAVQSETEANVLSEMATAAQPVTETAEINLIEIPVIEEGGDPADADASVETLRFDRRTLPPDGVERPFAYRVSADGVLRVHSLIPAGSLVILTSRRGHLTPGNVHAVRFEGRVVLSRVLFKGNALLLMPAAGSDDFDLIHVDGPGDLARVIAGTVVLTLSSWGAGAERKSPESPIVATSALRSFASRPLAARWIGRARKARLEDGFVVRDCQWKRKYGWRPVQRPEDMDYLDQHPGTAIRFRLIRDGRVLYHLEMTADQWRTALGEYHEGPTWRRNGYITPVTRMRDGSYTMEFKERWAPHVTPIEDSSS